MALRCLLFSSDEGTAEPIRQVLAGLGVDAEYCSESATAVERVTNQSYQIVIIDWDKQPEAGEVLATARQRKASERPLTLAIVNDDASVPKALQAGANSILRKPLNGNQVKDTLATARDLLRAKQESAVAVAHAAAAGASVVLPSTLPARAGETGAGANEANKANNNNKDRPLRAGEFLHSAPAAPGAEFVIESGAHASSQSSSVQFVDPLRDLEPVAAAVAEESPEEKPVPHLPVTVSPPPPEGPRGLEWYLKTRAGASSTIAPPVPEPVSPVSAKAELLGFDQIPAAQPESEDAAREFAPEPAPRPPRVKEQTVHEQKKEAELFAYMDGETPDPEPPSRSKTKLGKGAMMGALVLAACAILAAPQAPWHSQMRVLWTHGRQSLHTWLNPQPITPVQAPAAHEDFGRAGDEYKMPVEQNIPDATTDPSQIQVVPVVDPTAKKPSTDANPDQPAPPADGAAATTGATGNAQTANAPGPFGSPSAATGAGTAASTGSAPVVVLPHTDLPAVVPTSSPSVPAPAQSAVPKNPPPHDTAPASNVPSSLKSQIASMTPDASGNKAPEAAMDSIEPVAVPEAAERALLTDQPAIGYPDNAKGQQGIVILQVLVGRDGTVQDAKFQQGSLAFARAAIDGVKLWKFKPYIMNGRPVSVQTILTMSFKPTA
jgi:TonB family protein